MATKPRQKVSDGIEQKSLYRKLKRLDALQQTYSLFFYTPYEKQRQFHNNGMAYRERLLMAGNRLGKTYAAGFEVAFHITGLYPEWWQGKRFNRFNRGWAGSVTAEITRDGAQRILLGNIGRWGTGCIPKDCIIEIKRARGIPDAVESVLVKHVTGEVSQVTFKSYKDGREAWQAENLEWVWFDEEPPMNIYIEGVTRTNNTNGVSFLTFTPLLGMSDVVRRFLEEDHQDRVVTNMTIDDVDHYSTEEKRKIIAQYPAHEREARTLGKPMLGSGRIFPIAQEMLQEEPIYPIPKHWRQLIGLDFGWEHPTAAVHLLYDPEADCIHVAKAYRQREQTPIVHAAALRPWGEWVPVAWPHDGLQHDKGSGEQLADIYRKQGLKMLSERATFPDDRGNGVEAGLIEMLQRMQTGRFKVDRTLGQWWEEFHTYHRADGRVIKEHEDLMAATRYGVMMLRYARPAEEAPLPPDRYRSKHRAFLAGTSWAGR